MYSRILVPVDLSNAAQLTKALDIAARTAKDSDARVLYVGVVDNVPTIGKDGDRQRMKAELDAFAAEQAQLHKIQTEDHVALRGDLHLHVGSEIIDTAKSANCDLIVMASHVPGIKDHIFSSNAGYVATHAPMSVFVVR